MASREIISNSSVLLVTLVIFLLVLPSLGQAQAPPTMSFCGPLFLSLAPCAPFVQGTAQAPGQTCCDNLNQLYGLQPKCLCLVLGDTPISNIFPINRTLALELPSLCSLHLSSSTCSGPSGVAKSPSSQVSLGTNDNSTATTASPPPTIIPRSHHTMVGLGIGRSHSMKASVSNTTLVMIALLLVAAAFAFFT